MSLMTEIFQVLSLANSDNISTNIYDDYRIYRNWYSGQETEFHCTKIQNSIGNKVPYTYFTLNMAKKVAEDWTSLLFGESVDINISNKQVSDKVHEVLENNNFWTEFTKIIEKSFAIGIGATIQYTSKNETKIDYITGDLIIPISYRNSTISELATINSFKQKEVIFTLITKHLKIGKDYVVQNMVFAKKSDDDTTELGQRVPIGQVLPNLVEIIRYKNTKPFFQIIQPNLANNRQLSNPMSISIFANSIDTLKAIDIKYDSFTNEFILGKKRIIVAGEATKKEIDDNGVVRSRFDTTETIYDMFPMTLNSDKPIVEVDFKLRVDDHNKAINQELSLLANQTGLGKNYYSFTSGGVKTATEVVSENSDTFRNKKKHEFVLKTAITEMVKSIIYIETEVFKTIKPPKNLEINVFFDDSIIEDRKTIISEGVTLVQNKLESQKTFLMKRMGLTEIQADEEIARIQIDNIAVSNGQVNETLQTVAQEDLTTKVGDELNGAI